MTRSAVLCLRLCDTPKDANNHLRVLRRLVEEQAGHSAKLIGWGADRFSFAFPESERAAACRLANALLVELGEHAIGLSLRELVSEAEVTRAFGVGLVLAEALANAARPGEVLVDPELIETPGLARLGTAVVRFGDVILRASLCARPSSVPPLSVPDPLPPLPPLTPPPKPEALPPPSAPRSAPLAETPAPARISLRPSSPAEPSAPVSEPPPSVRPRLASAPASSPPVPSAPGAVPPASAPPSAPPPAVPPYSAPHAAVSPAAPPAAPLPHAVSAPSAAIPSASVPHAAVRSETPPPPPQRTRPASVPHAPAPVGSETPPPPPPRPSLRPPSPSPVPPPVGSETPSPARLSLRPASPAAPPFRNPRSVRPPPTLPEVRRASPPPKPSLPPGDATRRSPPPKPSLAPPREEDPDPVSGTFRSEVPSSRGATEPPLRPSVIEALRSGDPDAMLTLADQLRTEGAQGGLVARLEAMASLAQGEVVHGLDALHAAAATAKQRGSKNQSRTALALAMGLSMAGKKQEALLQGLEALSLARARSDSRGALACSAFLAQLARGVGEHEAADAWLAHSAELAQNVAQGAELAGREFAELSREVPEGEERHSIVRPSVGELGVMAPGSLGPDAAEIGIVGPGMLGHGAAAPELIALSGAEPRLAEQAPAEPLIEPD